jgi:glycosyltransferase involved in cell wall biosynthesis
MCTFDGAHYLAEQLASLAAQTRPPDELIVCDDCSSDESARVVQRFAASAPFPVHLHVNSTNIGTVKNFEQAIGRCRGDYIALCDQDDVWLPEKLARVEAEFRKAPQAGLIFSDAEVVDETLRPTGVTLWQKLGISPRETERLRTGKAVDELLPGSIVTGATAVFRSSFKNLILPIPDDLPVIHDAWMAMLIAAVSEVLPVEEPLIKYRQHASQQVGPLERRGPKQLGFNRAAMHDSLTRKNAYTELISVAQALRQRLLEHRSEFDSRIVIAGLEARISHLEARSTLPTARLRRIGPVLRELVSLRYHRYSKGLASAAKDFFRAAQRHKEASDSDESRDSRVECDQRTGRI